MKSNQPRSGRLNRLPVIIFRCTVMVCIVFSVAVGNAESVDFVDVRSGRIRTVLFIGPLEIAGSPRETPISIAAESMREGVMRSDWQRVNRRRLIGGVTYSCAFHGFDSDAQLFGSYCEEFKVNVKERRKIASLLLERLQAHDFEGFAREFRKWSDSIIGS